MLIDTSGSTAKDLRYETRFDREISERAVAARAMTGDAAALYSFNDEVTLLSTFSRAVEQRWKTALRYLKADGGTSLYDAIYFASRDCSGRDGRHVIVVVTDGGDTTSTRSIPTPSKPRRRPTRSCIPIVVVPITNDAGRKPAGEHALTDAGDGHRRPLCSTPAVGASSIRPSPTFCAICAPNT